MQETWVQFLGQEDSLEKEMAIHSSILAWKIPWTEDPGGLQSLGSDGHNLATKPTTTTIAYLTYMQNTSCKMLGWMKHKLESRFLGELSITSDIQMTPPLWQKVKN